MVLMMKSAETTFRGNKWRFLRLGAKWDRSIVPIYETATQGKCVPLLKTLLTNRCRNECLYCAFRVNRKCPRALWETDKLVNVTMHLWREGKIKGLFLSSSIFREPDYVMEKQLEVLHNLRRMGYSGYIHLRVMPGVSKYLIREAVKLVDRIGINLEAPNEDIFNEICPDKGDFKEDVLKRLEWIVGEINRLRHKEKTGFCKAGVDTQMVVGATDDNDLQFIKITEWLYRKLGLRRVYYSGFEPIPQTPLEKRKPCPPFREYRLYQCSFLIRDYGFKEDLIAQILNDKGFLPNIDPKTALVQMNPDIFPIDLNTAAYSEILLIPGIGPTTAKKIIEAREKVKIRHITDIENILGRSLARKVSHYVELKDKKLNAFPRR